MCPSWVKMGGGFWIKDLNWTKPKCTQKTIAPKKTPGAENWRKSVNVGSWPSWPVPHKIADEKKTYFWMLGVSKINKFLFQASVSGSVKYLCPTKQSNALRGKIYGSLFFDRCFFHLSIHYANFKNRTPWKSRVKERGPKTAHTPNLVGIHNVKQLGRSLHRNTNPFKVRSVNRTWQRVISTRQEIYLIYIYILYIYICKWHILTLFWWFRVAYHLLPANIMNAWEPRGKWDFQTRRILTHDVSRVYSWKSSHEENTSLLGGLKKPLLETKIFLVLIWALQPACAACACACGTRRHQANRVMMFESTKPWEFTASRTATKNTFYINAGLWEGPIPLVNRACSEVNKI